MSDPTSDFDWLTIEPIRDDLGERWCVYGHGTYGPDSVLEGQHRRACIDAFGTLAEARTAYPTADVLDHHAAAPPIRFGPTPPDWFDPADAGESW